MSEIQKGDTIKVHIEGKLENGERIGTSEGGDPIELTIGDDKIIPGLESSLIGMKEGDQKKIRITPEKGFGARDENLVREFEMSRFPDSFQPAVGKEIKVKFTDGREVDARVTKFETDTVTVDMNHPLAGKNLEYGVQVVEIV